MNNQKHGKGEQLWKKSGARYVGEWKFGKRDGAGTLIVRDPKTGDYSRKYCGGWKNGKKHGCGTYHYNNSAVYEGGWAEDRRCGQGTMRFSNGDVYTGEWKDGKTDGQGTMQYANGDRYEGAWRDSEWHGQGRFSSSSDGTLYQGLWVNGTARCGTLSHLESNGPTQNPIPPLQLEDPPSVLRDAQAAHLAEGQHVDLDLPTNQVDVEKSSHTNK